MNLSDLDLKRDIKRKGILEAALVIFKRKGYRATTVQEIVDELKITKGGFYHYFKSKTDLLIGIYEMASVSFYESMLAVYESNIPTKEKLRLTIKEHVRLMAEETTLFSVFFQEKVELPAFKSIEMKNKENHYISLITDVVKQAMDEGEIIKTDPKITTLGLIGMCNWVHKWYKEDGPLNGSEIGEIFADLILKKLKA